MLPPSVCWFSRGWFARSAQLAGQQARRQRLQAPDSVPGATAAAEHDQEPPRDPFVLSGVNAPGRSATTFCSVFHSDPDVDILSPAGQSFETHGSSLIQARELL